MGAATSHAAWPTPVERAGTVLTLQESVTRALRDPEAAATHLATYPWLARRRHKELLSLGKAIEMWLTVAPSCGVPPQVLMTPPTRLRGLVPHIHEHIGERTWERLHDSWRRVAFAMNGRAPLVEGGHNGREDEGPQVEDDTED